MPYRQLIAKELNTVELGRIRGDIVTFAREWEPRTFAATARKVAELRPDIDLYEDLRRADPVEHEELLTALAQRPLGVEDSALIFAEG
jgi:hypothetical protein